MGLEAALKRSGIRMLRAPVGDKYVLELMQQQDAALGGEQSGHILFPHLATTGDGLADGAGSAGPGAAFWQATPRTLRRFESLSAGDRQRAGEGEAPLESIATVAATIHAAEEELKDSGRVVIRYSGTEALARVMIEAESEEAMRRHADAIAGAIRNELGV